MSDRDQLIGRLIEEYHRRQARGERPTAEDFEEEAGACFPEFKELIQQEELIDRALEGGPGERLPRTFGEYTLVETLGRGGYGNVYRAIQRSLARPIALKMLQGGWAEDQELLERFRRGASAAAQVEHDHVVRVHDFGVFLGRAYLAMSLVEGPTLAALVARLQEAGPPPFGLAHHAVLTDAGVPGEGAGTDAYVRRVAALLAGPCDALHAYHGRGIIHRDVKPANLILAPEGRLVLTDFDLAKRLDTTFQTAAGGALGTPHYMSPEQWDPQVADVDGRTDVYGLGAVLFELLALRRPFRDEDASRLLRRILQEGAPDPRTFVPDLPVDAARVACKALARRPDDRYPTAAAFAADLRRLAEGALVQARPVPGRTRAVRWLWGRRFVLAALLLAGAGAGAWWWTRPADLHVRPWPGGVVTIDGRERGPAPVHVELAAGEYEVAVHLDGFHDHRETVRLERAGSLALSPVLRARDPLDPAVLRVYEERMGVTIDLPEPSVSRTGPEDAPARPVLPRGKVRRADLRYAAEVEPGTRGRLVLLDAAGKELWGSDDVDLGAGTFPPAVVARLETGATYRWGIVPEVGEKRLASFDLVADRGSRPDAPRLHPDDTKIVRFFEVALLQRDGFHTAALRAAVALLDEWPRKQVYALAWRSVEALRLEESRAAGDIYVRYLEAE